MMIDRVWDSIDSVWDRIENLPRETIAVIRIISYIAAAVLGTVAIYDGITGYTYYSDGFSALMLCWAAATGPFTAIYLGLYICEGVDWVLAMLIGSLLAPILMALVLVALSAIGAEDVATALLVLYLTGWALVALFVIIRRGRRAILSNRY